MRPIPLLDSKPIHRLDELPEAPGIYYVTVFWQPLYVGKSRNLRNRWNKRHQRYDQFAIVTWLCGPFARLHYRTLPAAQIDRAEAEEIARLRPPWNRAKVLTFFELLGFFLAELLRFLFCFGAVAGAIGAIAYLLLWR